jgi:hypothetical protein
MNAVLKRVSLPLLKWSTGLVVLWQSWLTFRSSLTHLNAAGHSSALAHVRLVLSGAEILAATLFLAPRTTKTGGYALLVIFLLAIVIHTFHGDFGGLGILVLYGAAVMVCIAYNGQWLLAPSD